MTTSEPETLQMPNLGTETIQIRQDRPELPEMGLLLDPAISEIGLHAGGKTTEGYLRKRREHEALPNGPQGCREAAKPIEAEQRRDFNVPLSDLVLEGSTLVTPHGDFRFEEGGFDDLAGLLPTKHTGTFLKSALRLDKNLVGHTVNCLLGRSDTKEVKLRTRHPSKGDPRGVYAIVGKDYKPHNGDKLLHDIADWLDRHGSRAEGSKVEATYDGDLVQATVTWMSHNMAGLKETFKIGFRVTTSDKRKASRRTALVAYSPKCLNYVMIAESVSEIANQRHSGKVNMTETLFRDLDAVLTQAGPFISRWNEVTKFNLVKELGKTTPKEVFSHLLKHGYGRVPGYQDAALITRYEKAMEFSPGHNVSDFVNALTRAAHTERWTPGPWATRDIEAQAGQLVFVRNYRDMSN